MRPAARQRLGSFDLQRREFLKACSFAAAGALAPTLAGCGPGGEGSAARRPNLLLVLTDDQSFDAIGYASDGRVHTPHLDSLAARGTIFDAAYCNAMPCTPSRGSLMSGVHWHRWRPLAKGPESRLDPGEWTWAHALREAGYDTALIGKMHFAPMRADHGFSHAEYCEHQFSRDIAPGNSESDDYQQALAAAGLTDPHVSMEPWSLDPDLHPISWVRDRAISYLEAPRRTNPFCLTVSFRYPHPPFDPTRTFADLYDPRGIEVPDDRWLDMENMPSKLRRYAGKGFYPRESESLEFLQRRFAYYYALVSQVDGAVGSILEHVDLDDTLVIFTSDHGVYLGRRGRIGKHPFVPFEAVGRVPMLACGPGVRAGARCPHPVSLVDLAPTLLTAAETSVPNDLDGHPLQPLLRDPAAGADRQIFTWGLSRFNLVRSGSYKYFRSRDGTQEMLFDLKTDPGELRNLAGQPEWAEPQARLARALAEMEGRPASRLRRFGLA